MGRLLPTLSALTLQIVLLPPLFAQVLETDIKTASTTKEEAMKRSDLMKPHFANGNRAMLDAKTIRQQLDSATSDQKSVLVAKMKTDYQTAIAEYELALEETKVRDENGFQVLGLLGVIRNGLVSQQEAVNMLVQDKDLPVILSNLGIAYGGLGKHQEAINMLQQAAILKPAAGTYMELGTDFAQLDKMPEAIQACNKILTADPAAKGMQAGCYKNVGIVLMNNGKLVDATAPLEKATQLNPQDALAWKLLGDALTNSVTSKSEGGKVVYVIPPRTIEAYQTYLQLQPNGAYAAEVKAALQGFAQLAKPASITKPEEKN